MSKQPKIIVITGAESTGKSTLAKALAKHCNIPFIPEYARNYIKNLNRAYNYEDIELIAQRQVEQLNSALKLNHDIIILDTWLFITKIWFEVLYQTYPGWLDESIFFWYATPTCHGLMILCGKTEEQNEINFKKNTFARSGTMVILIEL